VGELDAFAGEAVEVGCFDLAVAVGGDVPPALVVGEDEEEIGWWGGALLGG